MRNFLRCLAMLFAVAGGTSAAMADGGSLKDGPAPVAAARTCDGGKFAGFYAGAAVGYGGHDAKGTNVYDPLSVSYGASEKFDDSGFAASFYSGYNVQCGQLVVGYESDYNWIDANAEVGDCCNYLNSDLKWYGTSRLRFGLVRNENMMFYVTGGIAYAKIDTKAGVDDLAGSSANWSDSDWHFGWTAGGGVEFLRDDRWSIRAEAFYVDVGDKTYSYSDTTCLGTCEGRVNYENEFWVARVGLTYRFGAREEVAAPLK